MHVIGRSAHGIFVLLFAFATVVQWNDPDPVRWMALYGTAALASTMAALGKPRWWFAAAVASVALVWASIWYSGMQQLAPLPTLFAEFEMKDVAVEETRELLGLLIVAGWMSVIVLGTRRQPRTAN